MDQEMSMSLLRPAVAVLLATSVVAGGAALAAPKAAPVCKLVVDDAGDTASAPFPASNAIDITSADVASDGTMLTAVLRVAKYTANETETVYGKRYIVAFEGAGLKPMYLTALDYPVGVVFNFGEVTEGTTGPSYSSTGPATGHINAATGEITISVSAADLAAASFGKLTKGGVLKGINAVTFRRVGQSLFNGDDASTTKKYTVGAPSRVVPGK
jgi:hypothetical protein